MEDELGGCWVYVCTHPPTHTPTQLTCISHAVMILIAQRPSPEWIQPQDNVTWCNIRTYVYILYVVLTCICAGHCIWYTYFTHSVVLLYSCDFVIDHLTNQHSHATHTRVSASLTAFHVVLYVIHTKTQLVCT